MNVYTMRSALAETYTGESWKDRVKQMTDDQVIATYKKMERSGQLYKHDRRTVHDPPPIEPDYYIVTDQEGHKICHFYQR